MKSHLSAFLLFILLLTQSLSGTDGGITLPSFAEALLDKVKIGAKKIFKPEWAKELGQEVYTTKFSPPPPANTRKFSPPPPNAAPEPIKGLSLIKEYLSNYGYIQSSAPFNDSYDHEAISAIKTYQQYFNLEATGYLNNQTIQLLSLPRCGVPDINFNYNFTDSNVSYPKAGHRWFPMRNNLTYGFLPESQILPNATKVFRDSFMRWANATGVLNLTETTFDEADIKVGFYNFSYLGVDDEVYGGSLIVLQPPSGVKVGNILLNGIMSWALPSENDRLSWEDGILDLESAAMHQIGHLLGLDHSNDTDSIMYPYVLPSSHQRKVQLSDSDRDNIQHQYANTNSNYSADAGRLGVVLVTTFYVGFAYVLLLY